MSEFPELEYFGSWMRELKHPDPFGYPKDAVDEWFKQCMVDFPVDTYVPTDKEHVVRIVTPEYEDVECWFEKWFSQFVHKGEDE